MLRSLADAAGCGLAAAKILFTASMAAIVEGSDAVNGAMECQKAKTIVTASTLPPLHCRCVIPARSSRAGSNTGTLYFVSMKELADMIAMTVGDRAGTGRKASSNSSMDGHACPGSTTEFARSLRWRQVNGPGTGESK